MNPIGTAIFHTLPHVCKRETSLFDQNFGLELLHEELMPVQPGFGPLPSGYFRPWRQQAACDSGVSNIQSNKDSFKVSLGVKQFKPDEVSVKVVDNYVLVQGKHNERQDEHGFISRQFQRRYIFPSDVDLELITSKLSLDGILTIEAPKKAFPPTTTARVIPIKQTVAPAATPVVNKQNNPEDTPEEMDQ